MVRCQDAAREFGLSHESILDFSSNLNVLAPTVSGAEWEQWAADITRYPEPDAGTLANRLAEIYQLDSDYILPTAGAIDGLYLAARLFAGCKVAIVEPGFSDYSRSFATVDCELEHVILPRESWNAPASKWTHLLEPFDVVVLGNPNNPTGSMQSRKDLRHLLEMEWSRPKRWIVDEAFMEFAAGHDEETLAFDCRAVSLLDRAALAHEKLASPGFTCRVPGYRRTYRATACNAAALEHQLGGAGVGETFPGERTSRSAPENFARTAGCEADSSRRNCDTIPGIYVHAGAANFLLVELMDGALDARSLYQQLGRRGLLIRVCDSFRGLAKGRFIRLSVRTLSENSRLAGELSTVCAELIRRAA